VDRVLRGVSVLLVWVRVRAFGGRGFFFSVSVGCGVWGLVMGRVAGGGTERVGRLAHLMPLAPPLSFCLD